MVDSNLSHNEIDALQDQHVVILIHGIRDRALWQASVSDVIQMNGFKPEKTSYGRFDLFRFLAPVPFFRNWAIRALKNQIDMVIEDNPKAKISVIAHSFGTYVFSRILQETPQLKVHRVIFCGSVLNYNFPFERFVHRFTPPILNEVGTRDMWPAMAESVTWGYGAAGTYGFVRPRIEDRWHNGAKHDYFLKSSDFCQEFWIPFLQDGAIKPGATPPEKPRWWVRLISIVKIRNFIVIAALIVTLMFACAISSSMYAPKIILVDSRNENAIYDSRTRDEGGTNNTDIIDALEGGSFLQEFDPEFYPSLVHRTWANDNQIINRKPDVVIMHINAFNDANDRTGSVERLSELVNNLPTETDILLYSSSISVGMEESLKIHIEEDVLKLKDERAAPITVFGLKDGEPSFRDSENSARLRATVAGILRERSKRRAGAPWYCHIF